MSLTLPDMPSIFLNKSKIIKVFGQSTVTGPIGKRLDFEFGDIIALDNPDDLVIQKATGSFYIGHIFEGTVINEGVWIVSEGSGSTITQDNNYITLSAPNNTNYPVLSHRFNTRQTRGGDAEFECYVRRNAAGATGECVIGLMLDQITGCFFEMVTDENTWRANSTRGVGETTTGTPFTITNNTWVKFKIRIETNKAKFYVNNVLKTTVSGANVPDDKDLFIRTHCFNSGDSCILDIRWTRADWAGL